MSRMWHFSPILPFEPDVPFELNGAVQGLFGVPGGLY